ncbi:unnamed protein product [Sympodiomycopsis kandeliae]
MVEMTIMEDACDTPANSGDNVQGGIATVSNTERSSTEQTNTERSTEQMRVNNWIFVTEYNSTTNIKYKIAFNNTELAGQYASLPSVQDKQEFIVKHHTGYDLIDKESKTIIKRVRY